MSKNQVAFCCVCNSIRSIRGCGTSDHRVQGWWRHWIHCVVVDKDTNAPSGILILSSNYRVKFKSWTFAALPSECKSFLYVFWPNLLTCNKWALLFSKKGNRSQFLWEFCDQQMARRENLFIFIGQWNSRDASKQSSAVQAYRLIHSLNINSKIG